MPNIEGCHLRTADLPARDRLPVWREAYGRLLFNAEIESIGDEFEAAVTLRRLPGVGLSIGWRTPTHFRITRPLLATAADNILVHVVLRGHAEASQLGREVMLERGSAVLITTCDLARHSLFGRGRTLTVQLPRQALAPMVKDLGDRLMRPVLPGTPALKMLCSYTRGAMALDSSLPDDLLRLPARHVRDLVALMCGASEAEIDEDGGGIRFARLRLAKDAILSQLGERGLSAESIGAAQQVSADYIRKLFRESGTSFVEFVLEERLQYAHRALSDPLRAHQTIVFLAHEAGFSDISYFNRCFRRRFGLSPSEHRRTRFAMNRKSPDLN